jgi:membrane protease YdiL (CAAX protease family)
MRSQSLKNTQVRKSLISFFSLVILMSAVFWLLGALTTNTLPREATNLPISSLMAVSPISAALILVYRENGSTGVKQLLKRSFDSRGIKRKIWYLPLLLLMPAVMILINWFEFGIQLPALDSGYPVMMSLVTCLVFFIAAIFEEVGWQGYAFEPMQARWNALAASIFLGAVWAIWHLVPFLQMGQSANWIVWQSLNMVTTRILIVWIYNNNEKSIFGAILYHAMYNVSTLIFPDFGLIYEPMWTTITLIGIATIITFLWGAKTLSRFQLRRSGTLIKSLSS